VPVPGQNRRGPRWARPGAGQRGPVAPAQASRVPATRVFDVAWQAGQRSHITNEHHRNSHSRFLWSIGQDFRYRPWLRGNECGIPGVPWFIRGVLSELRQKSMRGRANRDRCRRPYYFGVEYRARHSAENEPGQQHQRVGLQVHERGQLGLGINANSRVPPPLFLPGENIGAKGNGRHDGSAKRAKEGSK
jgi:hypothetical protein